MKIKSEPTQVSIKDMNIIDFFDSKFVRIMKKHLPNFSFLVFGMYTLDEKCRPECRLALGQKVEEDFKKNIISVDAEDSKTLEKMLDVIEEYYKNK